MDTSHPSHEPPPSAAPLRLLLTLQRSAGQPGWQAEVQEPGETRRFASLAELKAWLETLEAPPSPSAPPPWPPRGIR